MKAATKDIMNSMTRSILTLGSYDNQLNFPLQTIPPLGGEYTCCHHFRNDYMHDTHKLQASGKC